MTSDEIPCVKWDCFLRFVYHRLFKLSPNLDADQCTVRRLGFCCLLGGWWQVGGSVILGSLYLDKFRRDLECISLPTNTGYGWLSVASSADGKSVLIAGGGGTSANQVWISTNSGVSWKYTELGSLCCLIGGWENVSRGVRWFQDSYFHECGEASLGRSLLLRLPETGVALRRQPMAANWRQGSRMGPFTLLAISEIHGHQIMCQTSGGHPLLHRLTGVCGWRWRCDPSMALLGPIYVSTNSGTNWVPANAPTTNWVSVTISADGSKLFALEGGAAFVSTNSGLTWAMASTTNASWLSMASSADGHKLVAGALGDIYTSQTTPSPQVNIAPTNGNLVLSWIVPSTNFVLQQNSDFTTTNLGGRDQHAGAEPHELGE